MKYIPSYLHGSHFQLQGHWLAILEDVHLKWQTLFTGTSHFLKVYDVFQPVWGFQSSRSYWQSVLENNYLPNNNEHLLIDFFLKMVLIQNIN